MAAAAAAAGDGPQSAGDANASFTLRRRAPPAPGAAAAAAPQFRLAGLPPGAAAAAGQQHRELQRQLQAAQLGLCRLRLRERCCDIERQIGQLQQQQQLLLGVGSPEAPAGPDAARAAGGEDQNADGGGGGGGGAEALSTMLPPLRAGPLHRSIVGRDFELIPADAPPLSHIDPLGGAAAAAARRTAAAAAAAAPPAGAPAGHDNSAAAGAAAAAAIRGAAKRAAAACGTQPPAPVQALLPTPAPAPPGEAPCIICLTNAKEAGFLHSDTVHRCVCRECAVHVRVGAPCPLCREPVAAVLKVF
jgi:hypothetical protein